MSCAPGPRPRILPDCAAAALALLAACLFVLVLPAGARAADPLLVLRGHVAPALDPIADGYVAWVEQELRGSGRAPVDGAAARATSAVLPGHHPDTMVLLQAARRAGAAKLLVVDLRALRGAVEADLRVYDARRAPGDPGAGEVLAGATAISSLSTLTRSGRGAISDLLVRLDPQGGARPAGGELPEVAELAAVTRAIDALEAGRLAAAWRELGALQTPLAVGVRGRIERAAAAPSLPLAERVRLLVVQGKAEQGWQLIGADAQQALASGTRDATLLLAAAEAQLEGGDPKGASQFFARSLRLDPESAEASLGLGRAFRAVGDEGRARVEFQRAASLDADATEAVVELSALPSSAPEERGRLLLEAGERAARRFEVEPARKHLAGAVRLAKRYEPAAWEREASLHEALGEHGEALTGYQRAAAREPTTDRMNGLARAYVRKGDTASAEATYLDVLASDRHDVTALRGLGDLYTEAGNGEMAVVRLEQAEALAPSDAAVKRSLARALAARGKDGDGARALRLHVAANELAEPDAADLRALAKVQRDMGDLEGARASLESALARRQLSSPTREALADVYEVQGDHAGAQQLRAQAVQTADGGTPSGVEKVATVSEDQLVFDRFVGSFLEAGGEYVAFLGLRQAQGWKDRAYAWLSPRKPDLAAIEGGLMTSLSALHTLAPVGAAQALPAEVETLFAFEQDGSRSSELIAYMNLSLQTDAVYLAQVLEPAAHGLGDACGPGPHYVVEMRMLLGNSADEVGLLTNRACVSAHPSGAYAGWNWRAAGAWGVVALVVLFPVLRGWGRVRVVVKLPKTAKALFAVSVSKRPKKVKDSSNKRKGSATWVFEKQLRSVRISEKRLKGNAASFGFVAARRKPYYITIRGPLVDLETDQLIGEFLEEKTLQVRAWRTNLIQFDLRTQQTAITVAATINGQELAQARVALLGKPGSMRFTSGGKAYLYADEGRHTVVVGAGDAVAQCPVHVESSAPVNLSVDLGNADTNLFSGCEAAVEPYLEGDYETAAAALERAGQESVASHIRATVHAGRASAAAPAAGELPPPPSFHDNAVATGNADDAQAAALFEEAGDFTQAAEAYERCGDYVAAARNFEAAYDWNRALICYAELDDTEKVIEMLERTGDYFEAAKAAIEADQPDRAIYALQQVDQRHGHYSEACRMLGKLLAERGEHDLALEKYGEAMDRLGERAPLDAQETFARMLEDAGRYQDALSIYDGIRKRDLHYSDVASRAEKLRKKVAESDTATVLNAGAAAGSGGETARQTAPLTSPPVPPGRVGDPESRYELLEELGRGGMGVVYKARDRHLGRIVALKVLPDNLREHELALQLFVREARAAAALNHRNIVTVFDAGQEGQSYFISMECLEGAGLDAIVRGRGPLGTKAAASVALQVAAGLDYAQRNRIVHRDIKPSNLFLTKDRTVKIMDFGLAKVVEQVRRNSTMIGGTPNFMAPEQAKGEAVDHRTDLYAFGGTLFELVTGTVPYESGDVIYQHVHAAPPDPRERNVEVPDAMAEVIMKLMAKDPDDRIQSAKELAHALQAILKG